MTSKIDYIKHYIGELRGLISEVEKYKSSNPYYYPEIMNDYIFRYNKIVKKYFDTTGIQLETLSLKQFDFSNTKKTVRETAIDRLESGLNSTKEILMEKLESEVSLQEKDIIPSHQMRTCLKTRSKGCPLKPSLGQNRVFVGMPFADEYKDSYEYGIKLALEANGLIPYVANEDISIKDVMCKICFEMQSAKILIYNISGLNQNVMLELGLSYGLGKETIIIKDKSTKPISDIAGIEYVEYSHAADLRLKLDAYLSKRN